MATWGQTASRGAQLGDLCSHPAERITICSDLGAQENKVSQFPHVFAMK